MTRFASAIAAASLLCCAVQSSDSGITLRVGKEWSYEQADAIASACAEAGDCRVTQDGAYAVSRRSDSLKRAVVDATSRRRRIIIEDDVVEPGDVKRAVLHALHDIHEETSR